MPQYRQLLPLVQKVLFEEWNPIGVNANANCQSEYDGYAPTICRYLLNGVDEYKLTAHLTQLQRVSMGVTLANEELSRKIAKRLLDLVRHRNRE